MENIRSRLGRVHGKFLKDGLKSSAELFCLMLVLSLYDLLMGETENPHFYDFGMFERVLSSQNHLCLSLETPGYFKQIKKSQNRFKTYDCSTFSERRMARVRFLCF